MNFISPCRNKKGSSQRVPSRHPHPTGSFYRDSVNGVLNDALLKGLPLLSPDLFAFPLIAQGAARRWITKPPQRGEVRQSTAWRSLGGAGSRTQSEPLSGWAAGGGSARGLERHRAPGWKDANMAALGSPARTLRGLLRELRYMNAATGRPYRDTAAYRYLMKAFRAHRVRKPVSGCSQRPFPGLGGRVGYWRG